MNTISNPDVVKALQEVADKHGGRLRARDIVIAAMPKASALHDWFEWDDGEAAQKYRLSQARQLINVVVGYLPEDGQKIPYRVWVSLKTDRTQRGGGYRSIVSVMSQPHLRDQLLQDAVQEMDHFQRKYGQLRELSEVFTAMTHTQKRLARALAA